MKKCSMQKRMEASSKAIPEKTLQTVMANLKCLGKPGKAMQNYPVKRRMEIFDELERRGWIEPGSFNLTDTGNELVKDWLHLCQESNAMSKCSMQKKMEAYREMGDPKTRVYFCYIVEKDGDIEDTAVFIDEVNKRNGMVTVYTHNDQHSEASIEWVAQCKPIANPAETEIIKELTDRMGYDIKAVGKAVAFRELGIN